MREAVLAALAVGLALAVVIVARQDHTDPETERWKEEAAAHQADADRWREMAEEREAARLADSIWSDSIIKAERARSRATEAETDEGVASLDERAQAIVRPLIAAERRQHRAEVAEIEAAHGRAMTLIRAELVAKENEATDLREAIHSHEQTIDRLEERLAPDLSLFGIALDFGCTAGLSATAGYGQAAGVGVTCGIAL